MKYTFKAPLMKEWTVTDDRIIFKNKELLLSEITRITHDDTSEGKWSYGVVQVFHNKGGSGFYTFSYPHSQRDDALKAVEYIFRIVGGDEAAKRINQLANGYKKYCNVCGHIFCYTAEDLKNNDKLANRAFLDSVAGLGGALSGNYAAGATSNQTAEDNFSRMVDYSKCPKCGSTDLRDATDEDMERYRNKNSGAPALSNADELKKFKDLLDSGVITQEEFDQKKKQLLGL